MDINHLRTMPRVTRATLTLHDSYVYVRGGPDFSGVVPEGTVVRLLHDDQSDCPLFSVGRVPPGEVCTRSKTFINLKNLVLLPRGAHDNDG
jgi:hypothetical protein